MTTPAATRTAAELLLPLLAVCGFFLATMIVFAIRCVTVGRPRTPAVDARDAYGGWKWLMEWWIWVWGPVERACLGLGISPNAITGASTAVTLVAAWLLAQGALALGGWAYLLAASLDIIDGRVARAQGSATRAGAFLDSTLDRVCELLVFGALAIHFRASPALGAALLAGGASLVVSYARARGEALGVNEAARTGGMQRAERVVLTGVPCALAPLFELMLGRGGADLAVGSSLALLAVLASVTAARRSAAIWRTLRGPVVEARPLGNVRWLDAARRRQRLGP